MPQSAGPASFTRAGATIEGDPTQGSHAELPQLPREDREIVVESEIGADDVGARRFDREHDGREILALVGIALVDRDLGAELVERGRKRFEAAHAEGVGGMDDRPVLLAQRLDAVGGDHAAGIGVVRPEADQPGIAHLGQRRIGAAEADGLTRLQDIGRHRVVLRRADRADEGDDVGLRGELREGEHGARIGRLVVLGDEFDLFAEHAAGFVDPVERDLRAGQRIFAVVRGRAGDGQHHADLDRVASSARARMGRDRGRRQARGEARFTDRLVSLIPSSQFLRHPTFSRPGRVRAGR